MSEFFSTQQSIEARISSLRLSGYLDRDADGAVDIRALNSGFAFARGYIRGRLEARYGQDQINTWTSSTVPELIQAISDDLCIYQYFQSNPALIAVITPLYEQAVALLDRIANYELSLYGVDGLVDDECLTERSPSDFDPERDLDDMTVRTTWTLPDERELDGY